LAGIEPAWACMHHQIQSYNNNMIVPPIHAAEVYKNCTTNSLVVVSYCLVRAGMDGTSIPAWACMHRQIQSYTNMIVPPIHAAEVYKNCTTNSLVVVSWNRSGYTSDMPI
jgi:hypothetical protein